MITIARLIATWFYCGYFPVAPGTVGSLAAIAIAWALHRYENIPAPAFGLMAAILAIPGIWAAGLIERAEGREDPGIVVVDEVVGQWITIGAATQLNWKSWVLALALFRIFDVWKPPPVRQLERLHGGLGIVADDAMAGVYAGLLLFLAGRLNFY